MIENEILKASKHRFENFVHDFPQHNNQQLRRLFMLIFRIGAEWAQEQLVHKPDNTEGITSEELAHQLYGVKFGKQIMLAEAIREFDEFLDYLDESDKAKDGGEEWREKFKQALVSKL